MPESDNAKPLIFFGLLVTALTYLAVRPVTLPCIGCDSGGLFYRCMDNTGLNTVTCEAWTKGMAGVGAVKKSVLSVSEYSSELIKFASHLPQFLYDFAAALLVKVRAIAAEVYLRLQNVASIAQQKMAEVFKTLKHVALDAWQTVYDRVINPVIAGLMKYVLEPITKLMANVVAFSKLVLDGVNGMLDKGGEIVKKAYNAVYDAGQTMSDTIELVMTKAAQIIETVVDGVRNGINIGLSEVVGAAETTVNTLSNSVRSAMTGIETGVNATVKGVTDTVQTGVNTVGKGIDTVVGGVEKEVNSGLLKVGQAAQTALTGVTDGVEEGVNKLGEVIIGGVGSVLDETEQIVNDLGGVLESTVNDTIGLINTGLVAPIESTINASADVVQSALDGIMVPVKAITGVLGKVADVRINLKPIYDGRPFSFLDAVDVPKIPRIGKLNIKDIKEINIAQANIPGLKYVRPKGAKPLGGRLSLQASIANAQKNWQYAVQQAVSQRPYTGARGSEVADVQACNTKAVKGVGLQCYDVAKHETSHTYEFLPPLSRNINPNQGVSQMRQGVTPQMARPTVGTVGALGAIGALGTRPVAVPGDLRAHGAQGQASALQALGAKNNDILVQGVAITAPTLPAMPKVSLDRPNLSVDLSVDPIVIPKPQLNPVQLKAPQVNFDVELDSKIPQVPNVVQGIEDGISALGKLLTKFFEPVWSAYATVTAMVDTTIAMVFHFFQEEMSWQNVYNGCMVAAKRGWQGVKEVAQIVYDEVVLPLVDVLWFLKDKVVWMIKEFAAMTMAFLDDIVSGVQDLGEAVWTKVKPVLKQAGIVTSGVVMYSLSQMIEKIPGMSLLPATSTTKLYMVIVVLVLFLVGLQVKILKDFATSFLRIALKPVIAADRLFDALVRRHVISGSAIAHVAGIR